MLNQDQAQVVSSRQFVNAREGEVNLVMRDQRRRMGWTQMDLASVSGVGINDIQAMERFKVLPGKLRIVNDKLIRVARTLEADFDELFPSEYLCAMQKTKYPLWQGTFRWMREIYLDELSEDDLPEALSDDPAELVEHQIYHQDLRQILEELLNDLSSRERLVMEKRFGWDGGDAQTFEEVGKLFGVTRERIRQIEAKAMRRLRHTSRSKRLRVFRERV